MEEKKGGSVVTENPNGGIAKNFGRIQREDHSNLLANEDMGGGWDLKSHQLLLGGITSVK